MPQIIRVSMAQFAVAEDPDCLETQALGSCVGIVLYDHKTKIGGLSHAMLPDMSCASRRSQSNRAKFATTSIDDLLIMMIKKGAKSEYIEAKLAGGANMFPEIKRDDPEHIGKRNVKAAKEKLSQLSIPLVAEETGGSSGRSILLDTANGLLRIRSIACGEILI